MRDGLAHDECCHEVLHGSRLSAVRPEYERVQAPVLFTKETMLNNIFILIYTVLLVQVSLITQKQKHVMELNLYKVPFSTSLRPNYIAPILVQPL